MQLFQRHRADRMADERMGLVVSREGRWIRATTARSSALFPCADLPGFLDLVRSAVDKVVLEGSAAQVGGQALQFAPAEFTEFRLAIALHWTRYGLSTGTALDLTNKNSNTRRPGTSC